jgi:hypothetical protein
MILKLVPKAASKFLFWLSFSIIVRFSQVYMSYAAFKTIFIIKAAFGIVLRVIGGFLNAAKSSSRRVTEGFLDLESYFQEARSKLYIYVLLSLKKQPKICKPSAIIQKVLVRFI